MRNLQGKSEQKNEGGRGRYDRSSTLVFVRSSLCARVNREIRWAVYDIREGKPSRKEEAGCAWSKN